MTKLYRFFAYGSLQIPEVMHAVAGSDFPSRPARLSGYGRYRLADRPYPGVRPKAGAVTEGVLYDRVHAAALARLDAFEDDFYRRETLAVQTLDGDPVAAEVYVVVPEHYRRLVPQPWDLEEFRTTALRGFLARCRRLSR